MPYLLHYVRTLLNSCGILYEILRTSQTLALWIPLSNKHKTCLPFVRASAYIVGVHYEKTVDS